MKPPELFSTEAQSTKRARAISKGMFLQELARDEILERLEAVNKSFSAVAIVTPYPEIWSTALPKANVVADTDVLDLGLAAYDLVIHAMALHHCNDPVGQVVQCERAWNFFSSACQSSSKSPSRMTRERRTAARSSRSCWRRSSGVGLLWAM